MVLTMSTRGAFFITNAGNRYVTPNGVRFLCNMFFYRYAVPTGLDLNLNNIRRAGRDQPLHIPSTLTLTLTSTLTLHFLNSNP